MVNTRVLAVNNGKQSFGAYAKGVRTTERRGANWLEGDTGEGTIPNPRVLQIRISKLELSEGFDKWDAFKNVYKWKYNVTFRNRKESNNECSKGRL